MMKMTEKMLLMGNYAIARGALEAGVQVAAGYPGTPASEIMDALARGAVDTGAYVEWSTNEKVALETAAGASYAGLRSMAVMKQVGLNVASDPLMSLAYIGVKGGMVVVVADDPGPHSSQTEQDTRLFAKFAKLPVFDPSTPAEGREMIKAAFELSESCRLPVILRPTTRVSHTTQDVAVEPLKSVERNGHFVKDPGWAIMPGLAAKKHILLEKMQQELQDIFSASPFNKCHPQNGSADYGVITSGISFCYVQEVIERLGLQLDILKIGTPYPLPETRVRSFLKGKKQVLVVEEQDPVVEEQVILTAWRAGLPTVINGKHDGCLPRTGEFNPQIVRQGLASCGFLAHQAVQVSLAAAGQSAAPATVLSDIPQRPPNLCPGCPHRASFYAVKEATRGMDAIYTGDIGCYTLGVMPPLHMVDTCLCMGASVGIANGLFRAEPERPTIAFLGDSTFFHAGIPPLINAVYNEARLVLVILDNTTTAMTGFQPHPGTGRTACGEVHAPVDLVKLVQGCGVTWVRQVNPYNLGEAEEAVSEAVKQPGPAVLIMKQGCVQVQQPQTPYTIDKEACLGCQNCIDELGCPALIRSGEQVAIGEGCNGCGVCAQVCPSGAITIGVRPL
jgi:indolepyruvate ferredoxin oxidoreductase alpha subunit